MAPADPGAVLELELWLDIVCPWCYLGGHRLQQAIETTTASGQVEVVLRSFELNPDMSTTPIPVYEYLAGKFAGTVERAREADGQVAALARTAGLPYTGERQVANSFDVHRTTHLARTHGVANQMFRTLQRGYFAGELDPFGPETRAQVAVDAGVPVGEARALETGDAYAESVRREQAAGRELGITGVPLLVLGGRYAVTGAQSVERYAAAIQAALAA